MLVLHPPKIAWPLGIIFSLIILIVINSLDYQGRSQNATLTNLHGTLSIQKVGKKRVVMFYGEGRSGSCNFDSCMKPEVTALNGEKVSVKMDQENKIYEIASTGKVIFNEISSEKEGVAYPLGIIFPLLGLIICIVYLILNRKNYGK